jgi:hypothetical protein
VTRRALLSLTERLGLWPARFYDCHGAPVATDEVDGVLVYDGWRCSPLCFELEAEGAAWPLGPNWQRRSGSCAWPTPRARTCSGKSRPRCGRCAEACGWTA